MNLKSRWGYTLPEVIITLAIIGLVTAGSVGLGFGALKGLENRQYEAECDKVLQGILGNREDAMMAGTTNGTYFTLEEKAVRYYKLVNNRFEFEKLELKYTTLKWSLAGKPANKVTFSSVGVIANAGTIDLISVTGRKKHIIMQPVTGRIYLSDAPPGQ